MDEAAGNGLGQQARRSLLQLIFVSTGALLWGFALLQFDNDNTLLAWLEIAVGGLLVWSAWHLRRVRWLTPWIYAYLLPTFCFQIYIMLMPAASATAFVWVYMVPMLAYLLLGGKAGLLLSLPFMLLAVVLWYAGGQVLREQMEWGVLVAMLQYVPRFFMPIRDIAERFTTIQIAMASSERIFELLDAEPEPMGGSKSRGNQPLRGEIEFRQVWFAYEAQDWVLRDVSFRVAPGESVAVVGATGAGKSTIVNLLCRFYEVQRGAILVDGQDIRDVTRRSLAGQMSMVLQEPFLFSGSVSDNIKYNHPDTSDEQMIEAAKAVGAHEFIMGLEDGYESYLHERGVNLSVGQRQLLSFARAIVSNPRILILDEATASIDSRTEKIIQESLKTVLRGRTAVVIAHRLSTVIDSDEILVLDDGRVVERGNHVSLLVLEGTYAAMWARQQEALEARVALERAGELGSLQDELDGGATEPAE